MESAFDIQAYMTKGVENIVASSLKATMHNPKESAFMLRFATTSKSASKRRQRFEEKGEHIPPFLIASITSSCNLHCAGCYSRCNNSTTDDEPVKQLTSKEWLDIFREADELGISFILLAGGEPTIRRDIIEAAGEIQDIIFPVFTNGILLDDRYMDLYDRRRNLIPVISIEGDARDTDARRGSGVYERIMSGMDKLYSRGLIFGAPVTVTTENYKDVVSKEFVDSLDARECKLLIYVEFVPVTEDAAYLAPDEEHRDYMRKMISTLRDEYEEIVFISFPGDEKSSGGCLAAGRGFFHINSHGGAEPCPFSPYSDINVRDTSLRQAMKSRLMTTLREGDYLKEDHPGGCVLFEKKNEVEKILSC